MIDAPSISNTPPRAADIRNCPDPTVFPKFPSLLLAARIHNFILLPFGRSIPGEAELHVERQDLDKTIISQHSANQIIHDLCGLIQKRDFNTGCGPIRGATSMRANHGATSLRIHTGCDFDAGLTRRDFTAGQPWRDFNTDLDWRLRCVTPPGTRLRVRASTSAASGAGLRLGRDFRCGLREERGFEGAGLLEPRRGGGKCKADEFCCRFSRAT
ncbi:hypothetical protein DFH06DRAFT_1180489, partial [Mycena polygramma]